MGFTMIFSVDFVFLTGEFLPEVSRNWEQVSTNGFLHRVPGLHILEQDTHCIGIQKYSTGTVL